MRWMMGVIRLSNAGQSINNVSVNSANDEGQAEAQGMFQDSQKTGMRDKNVQNNLLSRVENY